MATARRPALALAGLIALVLVLLVPATSARAATEISTPWPAIEVEPGSDVTLTLEVRATPRQRVDLEVTEAPEGWETLLRAGGFVVRAVTADDGEDPVEVDLEVRVPLDAPEGTNRVVVSARGADGTTDQVAVDLLVAEEVAGAVTLEAEFPELTGAADDTFRWTAELYNALPGETTFSLQAAGPPGWIATARPAGEAQATTITLAGGESATVNVEADPPDRVEAGTYDLLVVVTGGGQRVELALTAVVEGMVALQLSTPDDRLNAAGSAGRVTRVALVVANTGSSPLEDLRLRADPPAGWEVRFEPDEVPPIAPGETGEVVALVTPADNAITGDYIVTLEAEADGRTSSVDVRFQVRTPLSWGAVGLALIVAALAALALVFRRFGRR